MNDRVSISIVELKKIINQILIKYDIAEKNREILINSIIYAHQSGKETHGVYRLPIYINKINSGTLKPNVEMDIKETSPVIKMIDAKNGFGQIATEIRMNECIKMAKLYGLALVTVCNSNNFGVAAYFAELTSKQDMIGIVLSNSAPAIAPTGGTKPVFGTNPLAISVPYKVSSPITLDMASSVVSRGKIRLAARNNENIPLNWAIDKDGNPTIDPNEALLGSLLAIGDYKGYGLSMFIDILSGLISGSAFGGNVKPLNTLDDYSKNGHMLIAINISMFQDIETYKENIKCLIENVKKSGNNVFYPGEKASNNRAKNQTNIMLKEDIFKQILKML